MTSSWGASAPAPPGRAAPGWPARHPAARPARRPGPGQSQPGRHTVTGRGTRGHSFGAHGHHRAGRPWPDPLVGMPRAGDQGPQPLCRPGL